MRAQCRAARYPRRPSLVALQYQAPAQPKAGREPEGRSQKSRPAEGFELDVLVLALRLLLPVPSRPLLEELVQLLGEILGGRHRDVVDAELSE
jgi:hypothetical protein